jgi:hypothetical protein
MEEGKRGGRTPGRWLAHAVYLQVRRDSIKLRANLRERQALQHSGCASSQDYFRRFFTVDSDPSGLQVSSFEIS